jgi:hypothetical protein
MHPWTMQHRLADERRHELIAAAARVQASRQARHAGPARPHGGDRRATRYLGELLIRTGWRLVGPDAPTSGARTRVALRSSGAALIDPC